MVNLKTYFPDNIRLNVYIVDLSNSSYYSFIHTLIISLIIHYISLVISQASVSLKRLDKFLHNEELDAANVQHEESNC